PPTQVQTLEDDLGGDTLDDTSPKDPSNATNSLACDLSPSHPSLIENHADLQTQHEHLHLAEAPRETTSPLDATQQHAAQHSARTNSTQVQPPNTSSEREEQHRDASVRASSETSQGDTNLPQDDMSYPSSSFHNGLCTNELLSIVPCWDLDDITGEGSTCPIPSNYPSGLKRGVASKVIQRAQETFMMSMTNNNQHLLRRSIHLLDHIIPLLHRDTLLAASLELQATCRYMLFQETLNISLLDQSIDAFQTVFGLQAQSTDNGNTLVLCGQAFADRHAIKGELEDLDRAIELLRKALEPPVGTTPRPPSVVVQLGNLLLERYEERWDDIDLNDGINLLGEALSLLTVDEPNHLIALNNLGYALITRYKKSGTPSDVEKAIALHREALSLLSDDHPDRPSSLNSLGTALVTRCERSGRISDVEEAIVHHQEALSLQSDTDPDRPSSLSNLGTALIIRYERLGGISDVEEAIVYHREAVSLLPGDHPSRLLSLNNLANALVTRYERLGGIADVEEAIVNYREPH
ncbi:hypothetical protein FRB99_001948, partial [Tulasnella sp. 403]